MRADLTDAYLSLIWVDALDPPWAAFRGKPLKKNKKDSRTSMEHPTEIYLAPARDPNSVG